LKTLRDALLEGTQRLEAADLAYGHGTLNPLDEAAWLVLHAAGLPPQELQPHLDDPLTTAQAKAARDLIARRIRKLATTSLSGIRSGSPDVSARLKRLDDAERNLSQAVAAAPLLDAWSWAEVDRVMAERKPASDDPRESAERSLEFETNFGNAVAASARELEHELEKLARAMRSEPEPTQISGAASDPAHEKNES